MNFQVLYEDNHLIAVNKPAGVLVQGDETGDTPLSELVKRYINEMTSRAMCSSASFTELTGR